MSNSYTAVPNIIPGTLTVGGDVDVKGEVRVGPYTPRLRLRLDSWGYGYLGYNANGNGTNRDDLSRGSSILTVGPPALQFNAYMQNTANGANNCALLQVLGSDYGGHSHTGTTTDDTVVSRVLSASIIGMNGGVRVRVGISSIGQGAPVTTVRVKLGATTLASQTFGATGGYIFVVTFYNKNNYTVQGLDTLWQANGAAPVLAVGGTAGVDTSADQTLAVSIQNGTLSDGQLLTVFTVELLNSFGPV